jgi:hypothetical protein
MSAMTKQESNHSTSKNQINHSSKTVIVEIKGPDIYDPIKDEVKARSIAGIACRMTDDDDSSNFIVKQVFFCGGRGKYEGAADALAFLNIQTFSIPVL